jgi:hypothetical protein
VSAVYVSASVTDPTFICRRPRDVKMILTFVTELIERNAQLSLGVKNE